MTTSHTLPPSYADAPALATSRKLLMLGSVTRQYHYDADATRQDNPEEMSQSDWDLSGCPSGESSKQFWDAMKQAFELLNRETGKLWNTLLVEARGLIVRSRQGDALFRHPMKGGSSGPAP
jgi:hypothetical protein